MAFTKKTWADDAAGGTPITAAELNRIEDGISSLALPADPLFNIATGYLAAAPSTTRWATIKDLLGKGGGKIRFDIDWSAIQPTSGGAYNWTTPDAIVASATANGVGVHMILCWSPPWANGTASSNAYPDTAHKGDWQAFCQAAAARYIPQGVTTYELWNEPNIVQFAAVPSGAVYTTNVLIPGSAGVRAAAAALGKTVTVITAGCSPAANSGGNIHPVDFLTAIYANGGRSSFDHHAFHPYTGWKNDPNYGDGGRTNTLTQCWDMWKIMQANGDGGKKIWATEFGWPNNLINASYDTPTTAADRLDAWLARWFGAPWAGPTFIYHDTDKTQAQENDQNTYGLARADGTPKEPYYSRYKAATLTYATGYKPYRRPWMDAVMDYSPAYWWRLGEQTGTTYADKIGGLPLTKSGSPIRAAGAIADGDGAASFDGSLTYASSASTAALNLNADFTIVWWHKQNADVGGFPVAMQTGAWNIYYHVANQKPAFSRNATEYTPLGTTIRYDRLVMYAFVYEEATATYRWYVDGLPDSAAAVVPAYPDNATAATFTIGAGTAGASKGNQVLDDIVIYTKVLRDQDIWKLWQASRVVPGAV